MTRGAWSEPGNGVGVLDAGIALARLDRRHRSHATVCDLFRRSTLGRISLSMSVVNLAEALQHSREYRRATGLDMVALLAAYKVRIHAPDIDVARRVADLATLDDASLADRFAAATAQMLSARLYTTDRTLADALRERKIPVTRL